MAISRKELRERGYKSILTSKGDYIFRLIFIKKLSQEEIKDILKKEHKKKKNKIIDKQILANLTSNYLTAWEDLGYLKKERREISNPKSKYHPSEDVYYSTLKPLFDYFKKKDITLSEEEKRELDLFFCQFPSREEVLKQFPEENIINAFLKFYVKNFIILSDKARLLINENPKKFKEKYGRITLNYNQEAKERAREFNKHSNNPNYYLKRCKKLFPNSEHWREQKYLTKEEIKKYFPHPLKIRHFNRTEEELYLDFFLLEELSKNILGFDIYLFEKRRNPLLIQTIDFKVLSALNLCSDILTDLKDKLIPN